MGFDHIRALSELIVALSFLCAIRGRPIFPLSTLQVQAPEATDVSTHHGRSAEYVGVADGADLGRFRERE